MAKTKADVKRQEELEKKQAAAAAAKKKKEEELARRVGKHGEEGRKRKGKEEVLIETEEEEDDENNVDSATMAKISSAISSKEKQSKSAPSISKPGKDDARENAKKRSLSRVEVSQLDNNDEEEEPLIRKSTKKSKPSSQSNSAAMGAVGRCQLSGWQSLKRYQKVWGAVQSAWCPFLIA